MSPANVKTQTQYVCLDFHFNCSQLFINLNSFAAKYLLTNSVAKCSEYLKNFMLKN